MPTQGRGRVFLTGFTQAVDWVQLAIVTSNPAGGEPAVLSMRGGNRIPVGPVSRFRLPISGFSFYDGWRVFFFSVYAS